MTKPGNDMGPRTRFIRGHADDPSSPHTLSSLHCGGKERRSGEMTICWLDWNTKTCELSRHFLENRRGAIQCRGQSVELCLRAGIVGFVDAFVDAGNDYRGVAGELARSVDGVLEPWAFRKARVVEQGGFSVPEGCVQLRSIDALCRRRLQSIRTLTGG